MLCKKQILKEEHKKIIRNSFFFNDFEDKDLFDFLFEYDWRVETLKKSEICFEEKKFLKDYNLILQGELRIIRTLENGETILYDFLKKGGMFGLASLYTGLEMSNIQAEIISNCIMFVIPEESFKKLMRENIDIMEKFLKFHEFRLHFFIRRFENSFISNPYEKLVYFLSYIKKFGSKEVCIPKSHLADYLNIGRASIYRELNKLKKEGIISFDRDKINIL